MATYHISFAGLQYHSSRRVDAALQILSGPYVIEHQHSQARSDGQNVLLEASRANPASVVARSDFLDRLQGSRVEQQRVGSAADCVKSVLLTSDANVLLAVWQLSRHFL